MDELARKMEQARAHLVVRWSDERAAATAQGLAGRRRRRVLLRSTALGSLALAALVAVALAGRPRHREVVAAPPAPRAVDDRTIRFGDGSSATPLTPETVLHTTSGRGHILVEIERGSARFAVVHDRSRAFYIDAGNVRIEDRGTLFTVERLGPGARVSVEEGCVSITWPTGSTELTVGQSGLFPPEPEPEPESIPARRPAPAHASKSWKTFAEEGDFDQAYAHLPPPPELRDVPEDLLSAADVARLSHHPADAVEPLRRVISEHAQDPRAPLAGFTLGRILLEELGRPREAAEAFAVVQRLAADGPLVPDALAREVESWSRAGDAERARSRAEAYVRRFPDGSRLRSVRRYGGLD